LNKTYDDQHVFQIFPSITKKHLTLLTILMKRLEKLGKQKEKVIIFEFLLSVKEEGINLLRGNNVMSYLCPTRAVSIIG